MNDRQTIIKKVLLRCLAVLLGFFAIILGATKSGVCLGDQVFIKLGLNPWSNGTTGTHYPAVLGIAVLLVAIILYSMTTEDKLKTFRYIMYGLTVFIFIASLI